MSFVIPYLWLVSATFTLTLITKKKFEVVLPLTFILGNYLFYIAGMLGSIHLGLYFIWIFSLLSIPFLWKEKKDLKPVMQRMITLGFVVFSIFYVFLCFYHRFTAFSTWDEFQHWGPMIKETLRLDNFYSIPESTLQTHKDYPPFVTLLQALWCKLSGGYSEAYCYRSMSIFTISLFMPAFRNYSAAKASDWIRSLLHMCAITFVNLISFLWFYAIFETIYTDYILGIFAAYVLYLIISSKGQFNAFSMFNLSISLASLLMIKQMGIAFFAMALFLITVMIGIHHIAEKKTVSIKKIVVYGVIFAIVPYIVFKTWNWHIAGYNPDVQFSLSQISISDFLQLVFHGVGEQWQIITLENYIDAINHRALITSPFEMSYWPLNLIVTALIYISLKFFAKNQIKAPSTIAITYIIGFCGYALAMLMLYVFSFGPLEGPILASFERYINTYIYFGFVLLVLIIIEFSSSLPMKKSLLEQISLVIILTFFCGSTQISKLPPKTFYTGYEEEPVYQELFKSIEENVEPGSKVLLISQYQDQTVHILKYRYPLLRFSVISLGDLKYEDDPYSKNLTVDQWKSLYSEYDYAYTYSTDDEFYLEYWIPISDEDLLNERIYKINNGSFCLISAIESCK